MAVHISFEDSFRAAAVLTAMLYRPTGVFANLYEHDVTDEDCATLLSWAVTVLEQRPANRVSCAALRLLGHEYNPRAVDAVLVSRIARACRAIIDDFRARGGRFGLEDGARYEARGEWEEAEYALEALLACREKIGAGCLHELARCDGYVRVVLEVAATFEGGALLSSLLRRCAPADINYILQKYPSELEDALMRVHIDEFYPTSRTTHVPVLAFIATSEKLIDRVVREMHLEIEGEQKESRYDDLACKTGANLLQYGLRHNDAELDRLLGYGLLDGARVLAANDYTRDSFGLEWEAASANIYRAVLLARPQFAAHFRSITEGGRDENETTRLGRSLVVRSSKPGHYVFADAEEN